MQTTLLGLAIALILALVAALVGPFFVDWTQYRPAFESQASRLLGLPVRVSGPIDVRILPSPSLLLSRIEIGSDKMEQPLRARALGIELALGSLIRGQLRATQLRLVGPDVTVGVGRDGRLSGPGLAVGLNLNDVSIGKLSIEDARVTFADAGSGRRTIFENMWFGGEVRSLGGAVFRGEGAFVVADGLHAYRIVTTRSEEGDVRLKLSLEPSDTPLLAESEGVLSFPEGTPRFEGSLTLTRPVGVALAGGKTEMGEPWRVASRVIATPASALFEQLELQYGPEDRALKATGTAEMTFGEKPHLEAVVSARQVDVDRVLASQDQPRRDPVSSVRSLNSLAVALTRVPFPLQVGFGIDGVTVGGGAVQSLRGDVAVSSGGLSFKGVELRAPGFTQIQLSGRLTTVDGWSFAGPAEISSVDPRTFAAWLEGKTETPSGAASPLRGRGEIVSDSTRFAVERLALEVDRKPVNGRLAYTYASDQRKARLDAELRAADADIDAMMTLANVVLKDTKLDRPGEVSLALDMERARFAGLDAQRAHVKASFDAGGLKIERLNIGDFGGARIEAKGVIDLASTAPRGNVTLDLDARDLSGISAIAARFAPQSSPLVRELAERAGSASLRATFDVGAAPQAGLSQAQLDLSGKLAATQVNLKLGATGSAADLTKARIQFDGELAGSDAATLLRLIGGERLVAIDDTGGKVTLTAGGPLDGDMRFEARIAAGGLDARASGRARLYSDQGRSGEFDIAVARADAGVWLEPQRNLPLTLSARALLAGPSLKLNQLSAQLGGIPLRGQLGLLLGQAVEVDGDIETDAIDAAAMIAAAVGMSGDNNLHSPEPFTRGLFTQASGKIAFRARSADLTENLTMQGVKATLRFAPSQLAIEIEDAEFAKGRLSGQASARKSPEGVSAKTRIVMKGVDAALLSSQASGRINLNAELDGSGRSPKALIGSLSGAGTLTLADARISGLDPSAFAAAIRAVDQGLPLDGVRVRDVVIPALERGALSVRVAEAPFTVSGGQVRFGTLLAQADKADVSMSGVLDLSERTLESRILLTDGAVTTSAGRPEISLHLKGPLAAPARNVEVAALTGWLALRAVEQQSKKLEAIERGGVPPVTSTVPVPAVTPPPAVLPERAPVLPRTRPAAEARPQAAPLAAPLPPPVDIRPAPGLAPVQGEPRSQLRPAPQILTPPRGSNF